MARSLKRYPVLLHPLLGIRRTVASALCAALWGGVAFATPSISTTTRFGTDAADTGASGGSCRAPCPVVIDAGSATSSTYQTGDAGQLGIRITEQALTGCTYDHDTGGGAGVDPTIECTNGFSQFSWELNTIELDANDTTEWDDSTADANEFYHDGLAGIHGKPIGVRIDGSDATEGTCCALGAGEWGWCNPSDCHASDPDANRIMVRLADNADPDSKTEGHVQVIYGDGEYIYVSHADWTPGYVYVKSKTSDDVIVLGEAPNGASEDESSVTVNQTVNAFTDLEYIWSVSCTGGICVEDITNGDQRPGAASTSIDETKGYGPIWAFVFAEGFTEATIILTVNDLANGGTDTQEITVSETSWSGSTDYYISAAGNDTTGDGSIGTPWATWEKLVNELRTVAGGTPKRGYVNRGDTFTLAGSMTQWSAETDDVLIQPYGSGAKPIVTAASLNYWDNTGTCANIRIKDIQFNLTSGSRNFDANGNTSAYIGLDFVHSSSANYNAHVERGVGGSSPYSDNILWNCTITNTGAAMDYALFDSGTSTNVRAATVGCKFDHDGNVAVHRSYTRTHNINLYNQYKRDDILDAANNLLRIYGSTGNTPYVYVYAPYLHGVGVNESYIAIQEDGTGDIIDVLIEGAYVDNTSGTQNGNGVRFDGAAAYARVQNCIFKNVQHGFDSFTATTVEALRSFHNTHYTTKTSAEFVGNASSTSYRNVKIVNNAIDVTNNNTNNRVYDGSGTFNTLESSQMTHNVWDVGTAGEMVIGLESTDYTNPADWTAASMKGAQVDVEGDPGFDSTTTFALAVGSSCINAAFSLATVKRDYRGYIRPEPSGSLKDVGAYEYGATADGNPAPAGPAAGTMSTLGVGR